MTVSDASTRVHPPRVPLVRRSLTRTGALELGRKHGFRNAQTTLIPPTGTVSMMLDAETTGIEPCYALTTIKHFADGGQVRLSSRVVADGLASLGHSDSTIERLSEYALDHGHLTDAPDLRGDERLVFQTASGPHPLSRRCSRSLAAACPRPFPCPQAAACRRSRRSSSPPGALGSGRSPSTAKAPSSLSHSPPTRTASDQGSSAPCRRARHPAADRRRGGQRWVGIRRDAPYSCPWTDDTRSFDDGGWGAGCLRSKLRNRTTRTALQRFAAKQSSRRRYCTYVAPETYAQITWILGLGGRTEESRRERLFARG